MLSWRDESNDMASLGESPRQRDVRPDARGSIRCERLTLRGQGAMDAHNQLDEAVIPTVVLGCLTVGGASGEPDVRGSSRRHPDVVEGSMAPADEYVPRHAAQPNCGVAWCRDPDCGGSTERLRPWDRRRLRQQQRPSLRAVS